jgi:hypothetical protein
MAQTAIITVITIGPGTGPFNIYSLDNLGVVTGPFETGVTRAQLLAGFVSIHIPNNAVTIRVVSTAIDCTLSLDIFLNIITTTTTTTIAPITTSTTTTTTIRPTTTTSTTSTTTVAPTTSTTTAPGIGIVLGYNGGGPFNCNTAYENFINAPMTYYLPIGCLSLIVDPPCNVLYTDAYLTSVAPDGIYSDGINCYEIKVGIMIQVIPVTLPTTTFSPVRQLAIPMSDCTGRQYELFSNCDEIVVGCYLYVDQIGTPMVPGIYTLDSDPYSPGFQIDASGLIFNTNTCFS